MNGWRKQRLVDVILDIKDGGTPSRSNPSYFGGDIAWCVVKDVRPEIHATAEYLTASGLANCSAKVWPVGSVIISLGATIGEIGIARVPIATKQGLAGIVPRPDRMTSEFLAYALHEQVDTIRAMARGATIKEVRPRRLAEELWINTPPLEEQRRIVAVLDEAVAAIATATATAEKNLALAHAVFESILSEALQDATGEWETRELQSLLIGGRKISYGIVKPGPHDPQGVRLIKSQQVRDNSMDLTADFRITKELDKEYARTRLQGGEILLNLVGASIGRSAIAPDALRGANVSRAIAVIPVRAEIAAWVQYNLRASVGQELIRSKTGGTAQPVLNLSEVKRLPIPLPPQDVQEGIVRRLQELSRETARLKQSYDRKIAALVDLKQSLLHRAFSGEPTEREPLAA